METDAASVASEKHFQTFDQYHLDVAAGLTIGIDTPLNPEVALRLRRKIDRHIMPLMCFMYLMTFADKTTLGQSAVLGLIPSTHLNQNQFDWLSTIFYLSYLLFQYPQNLALQRFPVAKWMSLNIFVWAIALMAHSACTSFGGLFAVRFILGMCEGAITPGFLIITSMFYTREEQTRRVGYWFLMNGFAVIFLGFVSFGVLHTKTHNFRPWQWLMIVTGILTLLTSILFWFFFPDSPTTAHFLTTQERIQAVQRITVNQAGVENKHFKVSQFVETMKDPKTWIMALIAGVLEIINSLTNQRQIIVSQFGFTPIQTTLLGCVDGVVEIITIFVGVILASSWKGKRAYAAVIMFVPALIGDILVSVLPANKKVGLLFCYWSSIAGIAPFVIFLAWMSSITAGHTKKVTTNAVVLGGYAIGNAAGPLMWKAQYQPRNHVPWAIITASSVAGAVLLLFLRYMLASENRRRAEEGMADNDKDVDGVYVEHLSVDGKVVQGRVDKAFLDLTDRQNREFRYVL